MPLAASVLGKSRLAVGVAVPWVTQWSAEPEAGPGPCDSVDGWLALRHREQPGYGRPIYSVNHFRRQRLSVRRMLCPMCGQPTVSGDRWTQTARRVPAGVLRLRGSGSGLPRDVPDGRVLLDCGSIAPGHRTCMTRSLEQCPHLGTLEDRELKAFPDQWRVSPLLVEVSRTSAAAAPPRTAAAVAFLQLCGVTDEINRRWRRDL